MELIQINDFPEREKYLKQVKKKGQLESLQDLALSFYQGEFIVIGGRPSTGKTEILLGILKERNIKLKEKALYISFNASPFHQFVGIQFALNGFGIEENIIIVNELVSSYSKAIDLIEKAIEMHRVNSVYIDDAYMFDSFNDGDNIEILDEHFCLSPNMIIDSQNFYARLLEMTKSTAVNLIMTAPLLRSLEERGGDKRPRLMDFYTSLIELVASKLLLLYRPENYDFNSDMEGNSTINKIEVLVKRNKQAPTNYSFDYWLDAL